MLKQGVNDVAPECPSTEACVCVNGESNLLLLIEKVVNRLRAKMHNIFKS